MRVGIGREIERLEAVAAKPFRRLLGREVVPKLRIVQARRRPEAIAAGNIEVAGDPHQDQQRARGLEGIDAKLVGAVAPGDGRGLGARIEPRRGANVLGIAPGDLGDLLDRILLDPLL